MACDTTLKPRQTIQERAAEVRKAVERLDKALASGKAKVRVGPQGAVVFDGLSAQERDGITDACAYRRLLVTGSSLTKAAIARAEQVAGRAVDKRVIGQGGHYHGGVYHEHKG